METRHSKSATSSIVLNPPKLRKSSTSSSRQKIKKLPSLSRKISKLSVTVSSILMSLIAIKSTIPKEKLLMLTTESLLGSLNSNVKRVKI